MSRKDRGRGRKTEPADALAVLVRAEVDAPRPPRLRYVSWLVALLIAFGSWISAHTGTDWRTLSITIVGGAVVSCVYLLYPFLFGDKEKFRAEVLPSLIRYANAMTAARGLKVATAILVVLGLTFSTIELRDLPDGTRITATSSAGSSPRVAIASKSDPLRLHFLIPFRRITLSSDRHAQTTLMTWPVVPRRLPAAHLTANAGVLLRLPLAAQRYLDSGHFAIDGRPLDPPARNKGALLIGHYPATGFPVDPKTWLFPGSVPDEAQKTAIAIWARPASVAVPPRQPFRVAYVVGGREVAAAEKVRLPPAGILDLEMEWTYR